MSKHTPGPWSTDGHYVVPTSDFDKAQPGTLFVALCGISSSYRPNEETHANAALIAAAPEMLHALELALGQLVGSKALSGTHASSLQADIEIVKSVIAKARGRND